MGKKSSKNQHPPPPPPPPPDRQLVMMSSYQSPTMGQQDRRMSDATGDEDMRGDEEETDMGSGSSHLKKKTKNSKKSAATARSQGADEEAEPHEIKGFKKSKGGYIKHSLTNIDQNAPLELQALETMNTMRALHGVPPLVMDDKLRKWAEEWAQKLCESGKMVPEHSKHAKKFGESIFLSTEPNHSIFDVLNHWYAEGDKYDWGYYNFDKTTAHFTQLIWKETTHTGIGYATNHKGTALVIMYRPQGNNIHTFKQNVPPPLAGVTAPAKGHAFLNASVKPTTVPAKAKLKKRKSKTRIKKKADA